MKKGGTSFWYRGHRKRRAVDRSSVVGARAHIRLNGRELRDQPAGGESHEDDAIRRDAPFGGVRPHDFDGLNAVGNTVLSVLCDQGVVVQLSPEARAAGLV